ncbi:MAG: hypothetical protein J6D28_04025 [Bacilli bacterium]|nr:hypothetical protein [Bacilli bacterium]
MNNFTTSTYEMKGDILNFSKKISNGLDKPLSEDTFNQIMKKKSKDWDY